MYYYSPFFSFFFLHCFGCLAIVAVLVIVGRDMDRGARDMGRGAGEDAWSVVAEDIVGEVFDERFVRNKER